MPDNNQSRNTMADENLVDCVPGFPPPRYVLQNDEEKQAVQELRTRLADRLSKKHNDEYLTRFLRARAWDVSKAEKMLINHWKWREENGVDSILKTFPQHKDFKALTDYWPSALSGKTKDGSWIFVERIGVVDPKSLMKNIAMETLLLFHIYVMECHERRRRQQYRKLGWSSPIVIIQDFKGLGWKHAYKPAIDFVGKISRIDQDNYPEMMRRMYLVNTPGLFTTLFAMLKPFIDPVTLSKIEVLGSDFSDSFQRLMNMDQISPCLGGTSETPMPLAGIFQSDLAKAGTKVTVDAGDRHRHSVEAKAGSILRYHFATVGYNIGFGVFFKTKLDDEDEHAVVSIGKVDSQMEDVIDTVKCENDGFYIFEWDNTFSKWRTKELTFFVDFEFLPEDAAELPEGAQSPAEQMKENSKKKKSKKGSSRSLLADSSSTVGSEDTDTDSTKGSPSATKQKKSKSTKSTPASTPSSKRKEQPQGDDLLG